LFRRGGIDAAQDHLRGRRHNIFHWVWLETGRGAALCVPCERRHLLLGLYDVPFLF
jgi:hypothetical protein